MILVSRAAVADMRNTYYKIHASSRAPEQIPSVDPTRPACGSRTPALFRRASNYGWKLELFPCKHRNKRENSLSHSVIHLIDVHTFPSSAVAPELGLMAISARCLGKEKFVGHLMSSESLPNFADPRLQGAADKWPDSHASGVWPANRESTNEAMQNSILIQLCRTQPTIQYCNFRFEEEK